MFGIFYLSTFYIESKQRYILEKFSDEKGYIILDHKNPDDDYFKNLGALKQLEFTLNLRAYTERLAIGELVFYLFVSYLTW